MSGPEVLRILDALARAGVAAYVDGGWGVDALLMEQTREHEDLDLVIALADGERAEGALSALGFSLSEDERPTRFVLGHGDGRRIDFHTVVFDDEGGGVQPLQDGRSYRYPPEGSRAKGLSTGGPCGALRRKCSSSATSATSRTRRTATTCGCSRSASDCGCRGRIDRLHTRVKADCRGEPSTWVGISSWSRHDGCFGNDRLVIGGRFAPTVWGARSAIMAG